MTLTSWFTHQSTLILVDFLSSKWVDQRALAIPLIQCVISCITATIISTASNHPRIVHAHLSAKWTWILTKPICKNALDNYQDDFAKLSLLSYTNGTPIPPHNIDSIRATTGLIMLYIPVHLLAADGGPFLNRDWRSYAIRLKNGLWNLSGWNLHNSLLTLLRLQIPHPPCSLPLCIKQWSSMKPSIDIVTVSCNYWSQVLQSNHYWICPLIRMNSGVPHFPSRLVWLPSSRTWIVRKYHVKNSRFLPVKPKMMLLNYTPHPCYLKCPLLLPLSPPVVQPPGMLLLLKSHRIPYFPQVKLSLPWKRENSIQSLQVHPHPTRQN